MKDIASKIQHALQTKPEFGVIQGSRKFKKGQTGKRIIFFYSKKNNAMMPCESRLEEAHCLAMEFDDTVSTYRLQPFMLNIGSFSYTPDVLVHHTDMTISIREVKPKGKLQLSDIRHRLHSVKDAFNRVNIPFSILTEDQLLAEPNFSNLMYLYRSYRVAIAQHELDTVTQVLLEKRNEIKTVFDAKATISHLDVSPLAIDRLLADGFYTFNKNKKLDLNTRIELDV